jgi:hypothetical protein
MPFFERIDWKIWISAAALLFFCYTFWKQYRLDRGQAEQQSQLNDLVIAKEIAEVINAKKAEVSANLVVGLN